MKLSKYAPILVALAFALVAPAASAGATSAPAAVQKLCLKNTLFCHGHYAYLAGVRMYELDTHVTLGKHGAHAANTGKQVLWNHYWGCMSDGGATAGGSLVRGYSCTLPFMTNRNQEWNVFFNTAISTNARWMVQNMGNGLCMNNRQGSAGLFNPQNMWPCAPFASWMQYYVVNYGGAVPGIGFELNGSNLKLTGMCAEDDNWSTTNGYYVVGDRCGPYGGQVWGY